MTGRLCMACADRMERSGVIESSQRAVIRYGLDLLFSSFVNIALLMCVGFAIRRPMEMFLMLLTYIPLQSFGGGYHCQTHLRCTLLMAVKFFAAQLWLIQLPDMVLFTVSLMLAGCFFFLAPVEHPSAPFGAVFRSRMCGYVRLIYLLALTISMVMIIQHCVEARAILSAVILSGLSIMAASIKSFIEFREKAG